MVEGKKRTVEEVAENTGIVIGKSMKKGLDIVKSFWKGVKEGATKEKN
jgi:hypothetical protein